MIAGRIKFPLGKWKEFTCDPAILSAVIGYRIELLVTPVQVTRPCPISFSSQEVLNTDRQIATFLAKGIITESIPFKMESVHTCTQIMRSGCYMASIDLKDAYYSMLIDDKHQKYLKFIWNRGTLYKFTCLAQGLSSAPRLFTKIMTSVVSQLREKGHILSGSLDDSFW